MNLDEIPEAATFRPPLPDVEPTIRVRVVKGCPPTQALRIGTHGQWLRVRRTNAPLRGVALYGPVTVAMELSGWSIVDGHGVRAGMQGREPVEITPADDEPTKLLRLEEIPAESATGAAAATASSPSAARDYPGTLRLLAQSIADDSDKPQRDRVAPPFDVINDVPLEMYLPGVLAGELYRSWHLETHAAQAIAARSFACTEIAVFAGKRHYDVTNTAASQMYVGSVRESRPHEAVRMTRGMVLSYEDLLVSGYYSSCCGGVAATARDAIGSNPVNDVLPLHGRSEPDVCSSAPVYQWKVEQPVELLSRRLVAYGKERRIKNLGNFSRFAGLEIIASNPHGRPTRVRISDDHGTIVEMTAENFRRAANYSGQGLNPPDKPLRSSHIQVSVKGDTVTFDGWGFGHGVGLCQYGAEALAKAGRKHREIVLWYYPGAELVRAYA